MREGDAVSAHNKHAIAWLREKAAHLSSTAHAWSAVGQGLENISPTLAGKVNAYSTRGFELSVELEKLANHLDEGGA